MKADVQATARRKFRDPKSYVSKDGREVLFNEDWDERRFELLQRSRGQCEYMIHMVDEAGVDCGTTRCLREAMDPHHLILRSIRRDDRLPNLLAVCRHHHQVLDREQRKQRHKR